MVEQQILTEEDYLNSNGASFMKGSEPALHRTPRGFPKGVREKHLARVQSDMEVNNERRIKLRKEYDILVKEGKIRPPTRIEQMIYRAMGDETLECTKASRRLLEKLGIDWRTQVDIYGGRSINDFDIVKENDIYSPCPKCSSLGHYTHTEIWTDGKTFKWQVCGQCGFYEGLSD